MSASFTKLPAQQEAIRAKCFHPSGTFVEFPIEDVETSIPARFEKIVRLYPHRLAVRDKHRSLNYHELNSAANRVARGILEKLGEGTEAVMLLSELDVATTIICLAIFKAGKILVAMDPSLPVTLIAQGVIDTQTKAILATSYTIALATSVAKSGVIAIDCETFDEKVSNQNLDLQMSPDRPGEIRYSSGSTGRAKGIVQSHRRLLYSAALAVNAAHICVNDRLLVVRNMIFGARDTLRGLLVGAAVFPLDVKKCNFSELGNWINSQKLTIYASTPSLFRFFMRELDQEVFPSIRLLQLGAESLSKSDVEMYRKHFSRESVLQHRLSSGEAGNICQYFIDQTTQIDTPLVPIGYPVAGKHVFLVDDHGKEVESGEPGEIAVRSRHLSSEYWQQAELTKARFLPDPEGGEARIYLTGDLGRILPDGCLVYLGRKDDQVKIRGMKVSLLQVETALRECSGVKDAAVVAKERQPDEKILIAYSVVQPDADVRANALLLSLSAKLPSYMVPSRLVILEQLPLTPTGKVDRNALPDPGKARPNLSSPYAAPTTAIEERLTSIWSEVLSVDPIGIDDNFFDLGGHSLAASRVISRVIQAFKLDLPLVALFDAPTVAEMAKVILGNPAARASEKDIERILSEIEALSEEEANGILKDALRAKQLEE